MSDQLWTYGTYIWVYAWILDWTLPTVNVTYTRSQNYTNMVVGEYGIQTFEVVLVVLLLWLLLFDVLAPQVHIPYCFLTRVCPNILKCHYLPCSRNPHDKMAIPVWAHKHQIESLTIHILPYCGHFQLYRQCWPLDRMCNCLIFVSNCDFTKL